MIFDSFDHFEKNLKKLKKIIKLNLTHLCTNFVLVIIINQVMMNGTLLSASRPGLSNCHNPNSIVTYTQINSPEVGFDEFELIEN